MLSSELSQEDRSLLEKIKGNDQPLESVYIFGTNREALNLVISELDQEDTRAGEEEIALEVNQEAVNGKLLLIPTYQISGTPLYIERQLAKFSLTQENLNLLQNYLDYIDDDRVLLALHDAKPNQIEI